jgi:hypothetical protein
LKLASVYPPSVCVPVVSQVSFSRPFQMMRLMNDGSAALPPLWPGSIPMVWPASAVAAEPGPVGGLAGWRAPVVAAGTGEAVLGAGPGAWPVLHPARAAPVPVTISRPVTRPRRPVRCPR